MEKDSRPLRPLPSLTFDPELLFAAVRAYGIRDWAQAEMLCRQVLLAEPRQADAFHILGLVLTNTGRLSEAISMLREAVVLQPGNAVPLVNLGKAHYDVGQFAEAAECQRRAIGLKENLPEAHFNLSQACRALGQFESAIAAAQRAIELRPGHAEAHCILGDLLREQGRFSTAVAAYEMALDIRPDSADAHIGLAIALADRRQWTRALLHYGHALRLDSSRSEVEHWIGDALIHLGRVEEARAAYARASAGTAANSRYRSPVAKLVRESLAEVIPPDRQSIADYQKRVNAAVEAFAADPGDFGVAGLYTLAAVPSMMLAYYGGDVRPIMERYARAIGPHIPSYPVRPPHGKPKLGIVVTQGHEQVFARCWGGIAERLSRELLDVRIVCSRSGVSVLRPMLSVPADEYLPLPRTIVDAARLLHEQEFDWLHYWEIGTDPMNYYLPFFRTVPGQSGGWGWPVTSGNPQVNAYLSSQQLEPAEGQAHYTEQLVRLRNLPTWYLRPAAPTRSLSRSDFGLEAGQHIYLCTQNLRKYHPDFDPLLANLLRTDPQGVLAIIADAQASITELLLNRLRRTMPDVVHRVRVLPRMERNEYLTLVTTADVVLDTIHYGSGANTVYDTVAVGTPLVTLPSEFHRTRWAAAVNRRLGVEQLIASTPEEYVAKAVEVARDAELRRALCQQILAAGAEIFEHAAVVREHDEYFSQAIALIRDGNTG
ncbi:MAG: tetratricopeptide repeat protein [Planctomycetes bacterium]|nr:tetratricopeptide repeat protein [Planctomycetota bacterium]